MKKYLNIELIMTLVILLIVAVIAFQGMVVEKLSEKALQFPFFVFGMCFVFGTVEIIRNVRDVRKKEKAGQDVTRKPVISDPRKFFTILGMIAVYAVLVYVLGFVAASIILSVVYGLYSGYKKKWVVVVVAICFSFALYLLFTKVLGTSLPRGLIF